MALRQLSFGGRAEQMVEWYMRVNAGGWGTQGLGAEQEQSLEVLTGD